MTSTACALAQRLRTGSSHTALRPRFLQIANAAETDRRAIEALASALEDTGRPLVVTTAVALISPGRAATEEDSSTRHRRRTRASGPSSWRSSLADVGIRSTVVRPGASVHGEGDHGFVPILIDIARRQGTSAYVGDGTNRWPAVHRLDGARLYRLALERGTAGSVLHAVAESIRTRDIAEIIGRHLDVPPTSIASEDAADHFGWMGMFFGLDAPATSALTREWLGWEPTRVGLIEDLEAGHYFREAQPAVA
jgi:nucleoside-diphosphate-sugar epimerase